MFAGAVMMGERRIRLLAAAQALTVLLIGFQICASDVVGSSSDRAGRFILFRLTCEFRTTRASVSTEVDLCFGWFADLLRFVRRVF